MKLGRAKEFGFLASNGLIKNKPYTLVDFYFNGSLLPDSYIPDSDTFVCFSPLKSKHKSDAAKISGPLQFNQTCLQAVQRYTGEFEEINGVDDRGKSSYEHLCILRCMLRDLSAAAAIFGLQDAASLALLAHLCRAAVKHGDISAYWSGFLSGRAVSAVLMELCAKFNHSKLFLDPKLNETAAVLRRKLNIKAAGAASQSGESMLSAAYAAADKMIRAKFERFTLYLKQNPEILLPGEIGGSAGSMIIYAAACAAGLTLPRAQFSMSWQETQQELVRWKDQQQIAWFLTAYFRKAGKAFVDSHPVQQFVTAELSAALEQIINEDDDPVLSRAVAEHRRMKSFCVGLDQGYKYEINEQFRRDFNLLFKTNSQLCMAYLEHCAGRRMPPADPKTAAGLCDEAQISLFVYSGRPEFLDLVADLKTAGSWASSQKADFLAGFIKKYGQLIAGKDLVETEGNLLQNLPVDKVVSLLQDLPADTAYQLLQFFPGLYREKLMENQALNGSQIFELYFGDVWKKIRCSLPDSLQGLQPDHLRAFLYMLRELPAAAKSFGLQNAASLALLAHLCRAAVKHGDISAYWAGFLSGPAVFAPLKDLFKKFNHSKLFLDPGLNEAAAVLRKKLNVKTAGTADQGGESMLQAAYAAAGKKIKSQFESFTLYLKQNPEILPPGEIGGSAACMIIHAAAAAAGIAAPRVQLSLSWSEVLQELSGWKNQRQIAWFLTAYFRKADQAFVDGHPLQQFITAKLAAELDQILNEQDDAVLRAVVAGYRHLEEFCAGLEQGQAFAADEQFRRDFNLLFKTRAQLCMAYLEHCAGRGMAPADPETAEGLCDEALLCLFVYSSNPEFLNLLEDPLAAGSWAAAQSTDFLTRFVRTYGPLLEENDLVETEDNLLPELPEDKLIAMLQALPADEAYQSLRFFPEVFREILMETPVLLDSKLFALYAEDLWRKTRRTLPYCVLSLKIEDQELRECAVCIRDQAIGYQDSSQFKNLAGQLSPGLLYVADNVKPQDLRLFAECIGRDLTVHWDTSLMQLLLGDPGSTAARRRAENIEADVKDIRDLFWKQLYYVSVHQELRDELTALLPPVLQNILATLAKPIFSHIIDQKFGRFFDEVQLPDMRLLLALKGLNDRMQHSSVLIVTPRRLWSALAAHVSVSFNDPSYDYRTLSKEALRQAPASSLEFVIFRQAALALPSPVPAALPEHLRLHVMPHLELSQYFADDLQGSLCADLDIFTNPAGLSRFAEICFLGWEIENRVDEHELERRFTPEELLAYDPGLMMRFGSNCFARIQQQERSGPWAEELPPEVSNMWLRRLHDGSFKLGYNINVQSRIDQIKKKIKADPACRTLVFSTVSWTRAERALGEVILAVCTAAKGGFDAGDLRVGAQSRFRDRYRAWQLRMVQRLQSQCRLPVVYVLDDGDELEATADYAQSLKFSVCRLGSMQEQLDNLSRTSRGLMIISKADFPAVSSLKNDHALCYIFDEMAVEKHRLMWWVDPAQQEAQLDRAGAAGANQDDTAAADGDYAEVIQALWPEYQSFSAAVSQQNKSSRMYLIEPYLDDFPQLDQEIGAASVELQQLWSSAAEFDAAVQQAGEFFPRTGPRQDLQRLDVEKVMQVLLDVMVAGPAVQNPVWSPLQQQVLPHILAQDDNYMVTMPTGGGKSVLFQGPALFKSSFTGRLSVVITPLKALMQDQVKELHRKGFVTNVDFLNSDLPYAQVLNVYRRIRSGEVSLLYIAPERLRSQRFIEALQCRIEQDGGLEYLIFDEAHCISLWGADFRPEYLRALQECRRILGRRKCCTILFTATASDLILKQISSELPFKRLGARASDDDFRPIREHINFSFKEIADKAAPADVKAAIRSDAIVSYIKERRVDFSLSRMLVFCQRRRDCELLAEELLPKKLAEEGILPAERAADYVGFFHAGLDGYAREMVYQRFKAVKEKDQPIYILCATKAFGMGMDIPNIHYLMHFSVTPVPEDYLQEVGRAGRNRSMYERAGFSLQHPIEAVCLFNAKDFENAKSHLLEYLTWPGLEQERKKLIAYLQTFKAYLSLGLSVVMAYGLTTPQVLYWLESMKRIETGYSKPGSITMHLPDSRVPADNAADREFIAKLRTKFPEHGEERFQLSLTEISRMLKSPRDRALSELVRMHQQQCLSLDCSAEFSLGRLRFGEVKNYFNEHSESRMLALNIVFDAVSKLLSNLKSGKRRLLSYADLSDLLDLSTLNAVAGEYMPWHQGGINNSGFGFSKKSSYVSNLLNDGGSYIAAVLEYLPGLKLNQFFNQLSGDVKVSVLAQDAARAETYLRQLRRDCIALLLKVSSFEYAGPARRSWPDLMIELELVGRGFRYFDNLLGLLFKLHYLQAVKLLPMGLEVRLTDDSTREIAEKPEEQDDDYAFRARFDEQVMLRRLRIYSMQALASEVEGREEQNKFMQDYFAASDSAGLIDVLHQVYADDSPVWGEISAEAIEKEEQKLQGNEQQWQIYSADPNHDINVEAGPGSGKTYILTMRCARLIYFFHVAPENILVLAYNRAVVEELKRRLGELFFRLGLGRSAALRLHVYTFHSLARRILGDNLNKDNLKEWETALLSYIRSNGSAFRQLMPGLSHVLIDEFQDITQTRLDFMLELKAVYPQLHFFTIGDKDQSIYGFEKVESPDPNYYYDQLYQKIKPQVMSLTVNYRSFPEILRSAGMFLPAGSNLPVPCAKNKEHEPQEPYVFIHHLPAEPFFDWHSDLKQTILKLQSLQGEQRISELAVLFRTNNEVYRGMSEIDQMNLPDVRLTVLGSENSQMKRQREFYVFTKYLEKNQHQPVVFTSAAGIITTAEKLMDFTRRCKEKHHNWDEYSLDLCLALVLDYLERAEADERSITFGDLSQALNDALSEERPEIYKVYEHYFPNQNAGKLNIILTTMHKIKGLEFDAVITIPSEAALPFGSQAAAPQAPEQYRVPQWLPDTLLRNPVLAEVFAPAPAAAGRVLFERDQKNIEEEQRLLYVAFTRAKKHLTAYLGEREAHVKQGTPYQCSSQDTLYFEKDPGLQNYNLSYTASDYAFKFKFNDFINKEVRLYDPVSIRMVSRSGYKFYEILCRNQAVGQLSTKSSIRKAMEKNNITYLDGFYVSNVYCWSFADSQKYDAEHETQFSAKWGEQARRAGHVYILNSAPFV